MIDLIPHTLIKTPLNDTFTYKCSCGAGAFNSPNYIRSGSTDIWSEWNYQDLFQEHLFLINKLNRLGYSSIEEYYKTFTTDISVCVSKGLNDISFYKLVGIDYDKDTVYILKEKDTFNKIFEISLDEYLTNYFKV